ncbi:MAG: hypothetical protein IJ188_04475 [Clostridia bacterium]|nr:hypothetical protein [Clostridia bacterium]
MIKDGRDRWQCGLAALVAGCLIWSGGGWATGESLVITTVTKRSVEQTEVPLAPEGEREKEGEAEASVTAIVLAEASEEPVASIDSEDPEAESLTLELRPTTPVSFTNVLFHYVYLDAYAPGADRLVLRIYNPEGKAVSFRTRRHVNNGWDPNRSAGFVMARGVDTCEGINALFPSNSAPGVWRMEITAYAEGKGETTRSLEVQITSALPLKMDQLPQVREMILGAEGGEEVFVEAGKIRYIAQDPKDKLFVKGYWFSGAFDLRPVANQKCSRAVFSMALSWLGIDCSPIRMSELVRSKEIEYTYDRVCEKIGGVQRLSGDLETLWAAYQAGEASPVSLHFEYEGGMHALLLVARDEEDPELFYAITSGQRVNTSVFPGGQERDMVIPILIEKGEKGARIQSPLLKRYHKGVIDQIWAWTNVN